MCVVDKKYRRKKNHYAQPQGLCVNSYEVLLDDRLINETVGVTVPIESSGVGVLALAADFAFNEGQVIIAIWLRWLCRQQARQIAKPSKASAFDLDAATVLLTQELFLSSSM